MERADADMSFSRGLGTLTSKPETLKSLGFRVLGIYGALKVLAWG